MGGCAIKTISLQEQKFRELLKKYKDGDKTVIDEIVDIFAKHVHKNIELSRGKFNFDIIEALVRDLVIKDLERDRYTRHIGHYSNNYLSSVKVTIDNWKLTNESSVEDINNRIIARKVKAITNEQWQYEKAINIENTDDISKVIEMIYPMTYENLSEYIKNYNKWTTLNSQDIEDATQTIIIEKIHEYYTKGKMPKEYYNWISKLKRSLQIYLDALEKKNLENDYLGEKGTPRLQNLESLSEKLVYHDDILENEILKERDAKLFSLLSKLKEKYRQVMEMRYYKNYTYRQIASALNLSIRRIEQIEKKAIEELRRIIDTDKSTRIYFDDI